MCSGESGISKKTRVDSKSSVLNVISPSRHRVHISSSVAMANWENMMMNGILLVFFSIIHDTNNPAFTAGNDACVCGCIADKGSGTYYGNSAVMNVLKQLKLNLNDITCFEYTSP